MSNRDPLRPTDRSLEEKSTGTRYKIVDDSGVDYAFIGQKDGSWLGAIVEGWPAGHLPDSITVRQPSGGPASTYTANKEAFERYDMKITLDEWLELEDLARQSSERTATITNGSCS